ncbi:MAG: hypothetical protein ACJ780_25420 [Solirubrobacteraceae bacterium]
MGGFFRKAATAGVHMKLAVVSDDGQEASSRAWATLLECAGVPYELIALGDRSDRQRLVAAHRQGMFQGMIVVSGDVLGRNLSRGEHAALRASERTFGTRRLIACASPAPVWGLRPASAAGPLDGTTASVTTAGRRLFSYLRGPVAFDAGSWAQPGLPASPHTFETLLATGSGAALLGIHRTDDGRQEMVALFAVNAAQGHAQLLRPGLLRWLTRGTYLGYERVYLPLHIDDVLLANGAWDTSRHGTDVSADACRRMAPADAAHAADWSRSRALQLDLVCNGRGTEQRTTANLGAPDPLLEALRRETGAFRWINHTYGHLDLDDAAQETIGAQISLNAAWARDAGIALEPSVLITGAHSGLANLATDPPRATNPAFAAALGAHGVRFVASDASRPYPVDGGGLADDVLAPGTPFMVGDALAVPRHPSVLPFDAVTADEALDRLRTQSDVSPSVTWAEVLAAEAGRIVTTMLSNDPRPHYFHQSNLIGARAGLLYGLIDAVLHRYHAAVNGQMPVLQPAFADIGGLLARWSNWQAAVRDGSVAARRHGRRVIISNQSDAALSVPLTGCAVGDRYAGTRSGWISAGPGETRVGIEPEGLIQTPPQ